MCKDKVRKALVVGIIGVQCTMVGSTAYAKSDVEVTHAVSNCIHYRNAEGMVFSEQVKQRFDDALRDGLHTEECIVNLSSLYKNDRYVDVKSNVWYFGSVRDLYQVKLMQGESADRFNPSGNITVAQAIAVASRVNSLYETGSLDALNQYGGARWYDGAVKYALEKGIIKANDFNSGAMNRPATRGELSYILYNSIPSKELEAINNFTLNDVKDLNATTKYSDSILKAINAGLLTGYEDGTIKPNNRITRAEAACIIDRVVRPNGRIKRANADVSNGRQRHTVYVTPRTQHGTQSVTTTPSAWRTPINVYYGTHTYLSNTQEEYDVVMKAVHDMLEFKGPAGELLKESLDLWGTDTRLRNGHINIYRRMVGPNISEVEAKRYFYVDTATTAIVAAYLRSTKDNVDSAYETITTGYGDCTATTMLKLAVLDALGYNSKAVANSTHEWPLGEIDGVWYCFDGGLSNSIGTYNRVTVRDTFNNAP